MKRLVLAVLSIAALVVVSSTSSADTVCRVTSDGGITVCTCDSSSSCDDLAATCRSHDTSLSCNPEGTVCGCAWAN